MATSLQFRKWFDREAKIRQNSLANAATGTTTWTLIDAIGVEAIENIMKGVDATAVDTHEAAGQYGNALAYRNFLDNMRDAAIYLGYATPYIDSMLAGFGWRVPYEAAQMYYEAKGSRLQTHHVFPKGTYATGALSATGMHKFGRLTGTAGASTYAETDGALDRTRMIGSVIVAHSVEADVADSSLKVDPVKQDGVSKIAAGLTIQPGELLNDHVLVGEQAITARSSATVLTCAATAQFTEGDWVLLWENADGDTSLREVAQVKTIVANTSLEFESAMVETFSNAGFIYPMYTNIGLKSGTIANTKHVDFYAMPDRIIAL
jgi:hypothetical protein